MYISKEDIDEITRRYGVSGDVAALQRAYRMQQAQRFLSNLWDDDGVRLAMSVKGGKYVLIDYCNDKRGLNALHQQLQGQMKGLNRSDSKVLVRIEKLKTMITCFTRQDLFFNLVPADNLRVFVESLRVYVHPGGNRHAV